MSVELESLQQQQKINNNKKRKEHVTYSVKIIFFEIRALPYKKHKNVLTHGLVWFITQQSICVT